MPVPTLSSLLSNEPTLRGARNGQSLFRSKAVFTSSMGGCGGCGHHRAAHWDGIDAVLHISQ